ncbi:MAG TPA: hypothetical protein VFM81_11200 [Actinomycetota bacterium]|nr:hypothetical protein [Actinomycetota bacterium]
MALAIALVAVAGVAFAAGRTSAPTASQHKTPAGSGYGTQVRSMMPWVQGHMSDIRWMQNHMGDLAWMQGHAGQWRWAENHPSQWAWMQDRFGDVPWMQRNWTQLRWMMNNPTDWSWMRAHMGDIGWMHDHDGSWTQWRSGMGMWGGGTNHGTHGMMNGGWGR